jgi:hypothetical protein
VSLHLHPGFFGDPPVDVHDIVAVLPSERGFHAVDEHLERLAVVAEYDHLLRWPAPFFQGLAGPQEVENELQLAAVGRIDRASILLTESARGSVSDFSDACLRRKEQNEIFIPTQKLHA